MWRFIILTYSFNVFHNVKYLRFRQVIFHLGRYGGSQKFVKNFFVWGKPIGEIHSSYVYSSSCYHRIHVLLLLLSLFFCISLLRILNYLHDFHFNPLFFLMYVHLHWDVHFQPCLVLYSTPDSVYKLSFVHTRVLVSLWRGKSCICRKYSNRYRGQSSVLTVHVVDAYRGVEVQLHLFLALTQDGRVWFSSPPVSFIPGNVKFVIYFKWVYIFQTLLPSA
jgi:glycosyltransferase involved in cell wall biosynthesis